MAKRGRPAAAVRPIVFRVALRLYPDLNDPLIAYLQNAPPRLRAQYGLRAMLSGVQGLVATDTERQADDDLLFDGLMQ